MLYWTTRSECSIFFFFNDTATTEIYTLSLHDALPISRHVIIAPMQHTAAEVIAVFHRDMIAVVIAAVLITMGAGMLLLGALTAGKSRRSFVYTGLFAIAYGMRLAFNTVAYTLLYGHPRW